MKAWCLACDETALIANLSVYRGHLVGGAHLPSVSPAPLNNKPAAPPSASKDRGKVVGITNEATAVDSRDIGTPDVSQNDAPLESWAEFRELVRKQKKLRNAKLDQGVYVASQRMDAKAISRELLQVVYRSSRMRMLLERHATIECFKQDVEGFKSRRVLSPDFIEHQRIARYPTLRCMSGRELRIETLVDSSSFRDVYRYARKCVGLQPRADSRSLRLIYIGNRLPEKDSEWTDGEEIPCNDALAYRRLRGAILQAIIHS